MARVISEEWFDQLCELLLDEGCIETQMNFEREAVVVEEREEGYTLANGERQRMWVEE